MALNVSPMSMNIYSYTSTPESFELLHLDFPFHIFSNFCEPDENYFDVKKLSTHYYTVAMPSRTVLQFSCLTNFHRVSGDMEMTCLPNGTWVGSEPKCAVDFLKDKFSLSLIIITWSFILPVIWLGLDFYFWTKKRRYLRRVHGTLLTDMHRLGVDTGHPKPHRVQAFYHNDGTSVDSYASVIRLRNRELGGHLRKDYYDVEEYFGALHGIPIALKHSSYHRRKTKSDLGLKTLPSRKNLLNIYGTLGRAVFQDLIRPPKMPHIIGSFASSDSSKSTQAKEAMDHGRKSQPGRPITRSKTAFRSKTVLVP